MDQYHYSAERWLNVVALEGSYRLLALDLVGLSSHGLKREHDPCAARPLLQDLSFLRLFLLRPRLKLRSPLISQRSLVINTCTRKCRPSAKRARKRHWLGPTGNGIYLPPG